MNKAKEITKAKKALEAAEAKLHYLRRTAHFRPLTAEECKKRKLCTTSIEGGKLRCGRKAYVGYRSRDEKKFKRYGIHFACPSCCPLWFPSDVARCDMKTGEIINE